MSVELVPDIVNPELFVGRSQLHNWRPPSVSGELGDRERILKGFLTPPEISIQISFGIYVHALPHPDERPYDELFTEEAHRASDDVKSFMTHEAAYIMSLALWEDREMIINYPEGFSSYSARYDGQRRKLRITKPEDLQRELYEKIDTEYLPGLARGAKSRKNLSNLRVTDFAKELRELGDEETADFLEQMCADD